MTVDPRKTALFIPDGLRKFKYRLFESIGGKLGRVVRGDVNKLDELPEDIIPVIGCTPALRPLYDKWMKSGRKFIYWDRGYLRRVFATWLPKGAGIGIPMGYYRWHLNAPQMREVYDVPSDRFDFLRLTDKCEKGNQVKPWNKGGDHIVVADTLPDYWKLFSDPLWTKRTVETLRQYTKRPIRVRDKESKLDLKIELANAHCLVAHGSIAAVESAVMGCPVFVESTSAAALVGETDLAKIENPVYPERDKWLHSLAYCQFNERELVDGTLWRLIR